MNQLSLSQEPDSTRRPEAGSGDDVGEVDRISSLPDDLLLDILARLGCAQEAARTSVLARRWRGLWTRLPELTFLDVPLVTIERLLAQVTRPVLNLLDVAVGYQKPFAVAAEDHFTSLLRAAERLAPKNLSIKQPELWGRPRIFHDIVVPCLNRTTSLTLHLPEFYLAPPPAGEFTALESLVLGSRNMLPDSLLPMCPSLRSLKFFAFNYFTEAIVHSTSLEKLVLGISHDDGYFQIDRIDIMTPLLKEATITFIRGEHDLSVSFSAPLVEEIYWMCIYPREKVGLEYMRLSELLYSLSHGIHELHLKIECGGASIFRQDCFLIFDGDELPDAEWSFEEEIEKHPCPQFSVLVLELETKGHAFGPLVLHLLQIRPVQTLKVNLLRRGKVSCPLDCPCDQHTNWRNESISLTELEKVTIGGFQGEDDEVDFLKVLFRCATVLKSIRVEVAAGGYHKVCSICEQYPHINCDISALE
ncbi:hypothetical protein EJB05_35066, partial [Eragrostis curvula]